MLSVIVFCGPTLSAAEALRELPATYLPPVAQGDVYHAALRKPWAIGIIDGYFQRVPAVWHKEILWAMAQGVHVFGSASMGALRAAELAPFGMEGVGWVFDAFRDGRLEDDDEVAVVHEDEDSRGHAPLSEAMVNIRRSLEAAEAQGILGGATHQRLLRLAKETFYAERSFASLLQQAARCGLPGEELARLEAWLPGGRVDQKRADALAMLRLIRARAAGEREPKRVDFEFQSTTLWQEARRQCARRPQALSPEAVGDVGAHELIDELRLISTREEWSQIMDVGLCRSLLLREVGRRSFAVDPDNLVRQLESFRRRSGLLRGEDVERWMDANGLKGEGLLGLMIEECMLAWGRHEMASGLAESLAQYLRLSGRYPALAQRARHKQQLLAERGLADPTPGDAAPSTDALLLWYEARCRGEGIGDIDAHVRALGYENEAAFWRALRREYHYCASAEERP